MLMISKHGFRRDKIGNGIQDDHVVSKCSLTEPLIAIKHSTVRTHDLIHFLM